jgi:hypothetical protein
MPEHTLEKTKEIAQIFSKQYNLENNSNYQWIDNRSYQPGEPYDFKLFDNDKEIGIQLTRAVADEVREFIRPKLAGEVIKGLLASLKQSGLPPLFIYLNFHKPPKKKEDIKEAVYWLHFFITQKTINATRANYFNYHSHFDDQFLPKIKEYVDQIEISPRPDKQGIEIMFGWSKGFGEPWLDDEQRVLKEVKKKEIKYTDIILLMDSNSFPISDFYISIIKESLVNSKIKEIWLVDNFQMPKSRAVRVK